MKTEKRSVCCFMRMSYSACIIPQGGPGYEARSGQGACSAQGARGRLVEGEKTRVQQLNQLHVLLQQHILVQNAPHRVLAEHTVLRENRKQGSRKKTSVVASLPAFFSVSHFTYQLLAQLTRCGRLVNRTPSPQHFSQSP